MLTGEPPIYVTSSVELPDDYGRHHARCSGCGAWLCRYHDPSETGGLCWPCAPGGDGIVIEVAPGEWQRVPYEELLARMGRDKGLFEQLHPEEVAAA